MTLMPRYKPRVDKAQSPHKTIQTIRGILFANDIFTLEEAWFNRNTDEPFKSVSVAMPGTDFTTAGKGRDELFALASAYAEWMERIQTLLLIRSNFLVGNQDVKAVRFPDGRPLIFEEYAAAHEDILKLLFNSKDIRELEFISDCADGVSLHPYYEVISDTVQELPLELINLFCGSNGLCAGNTPEEAIIQGMCEIFERFLLREIYAKQELSFPSIPAGLFELSPIQSYLEVLKSMAIDVEIKDCSLGGKFPVVGVVIRKNGKALLNLGSSPDYIVAIERCFTELFQGWEAHSIEEKMVPVVKGQDLLPGEVAKHLSMDDHLLQYYNQIKRGDGRVPQSMLDKNGSFKEEHLFKASRCFDSKALLNLIEKAKAISSQIFIRDVSFLGFPTYQIYIPGITEIMSIDSEMSIERFKLTSTGIPRSRKFFFNIGKSNSDEIHYLALTLERMLREPFIENSTILQTICNLSLREELELDNLDPENLLVLLYCKIKLFHKAFEVMDRYLKERLTSDHLQSPPDFFVEHVCLLRVLKALSEGHEPMHIQVMLRDEFPPDMITDTCNSLIDIDMQDVLGIPHCEDCGYCSLKRACACEEIVRFSERIQTKVDTYPFDQSAMADVFRSINSC